MPLSKQFGTSNVASFVHELKWDAIPEDARASAIRSLTDTVATIIGGSVTPAAKLAARVAEAEAGGARVPLVASPGRFSNASMSAFANAVAASALDFDDGHYLGGSMHPGAPVLAALLAVGSERSVSLSEILCAQVAAYEVAIRAGYLLWPSNGTQRRHTAGTAAAIGVAAGAARLRGLDDVGIRRAMQIAWCHAPMAGLQLPMAKEALGWASATGVFAALLAENGFMELLDTQQVVPDSMAPVWPATVFDECEGEGLEFVETLSSVWEVNNVYFKPYPSCRYTHAALDAISDLMTSQGIQHRDVERIVVRTHRRGAWLDDRRPQSMEHAQYSVPYVVALLLVFGTVHPSGFTPKALEDPILLALADRVDVIHEPALDAYYPKQYPSCVEVTLRDGSTLRNERFSIAGDPDSPLTPEQLSAKFEGLVAPLRGVAVCGELLRLLGETEDHSLWELEHLLFS